MKSNFIKILLFFTCLALSCRNDKKPAQTSVKDNERQYYNAIIGWHIDIPQGYKQTHENSLKLNDENGKNAVKQNYNTEVNTDSIMHLLSFQRNQFNLFDSTIKKFDVKRDGDYLKNNAATQKMLYDIYAAQKIRIDTSSFTQKISDVPFQVFNIKIYGPNGSVVMQQQMYAALIKGYDLGINISFNNEADKDVLLNALKASTFEK
ncbi:hypothetical protein [Pedobacter montanisoli]|uniref:DUF4840 domain-containing protein n=1 Tax=Pedobacter montanisoli TaxID=2923277 RepID=A0ABS9ZVJ9_9SPHI|nr:hypothetical protein [Pedobacter montanisoli]MCJ0742049.1 hypothetical protein [Pedobacter montanisoli]